MAGVAWYFAYGSNMDGAQMVRRGVPFVSCEGAVLGDHRLEFDFPSPSRWLGGAADVVPSPGDEVEGLLYGLADMRLLDAMDRWEGVSERMYERRRVAVRTLATRRPVVPWTYTVVEPRPGLLPSPGYVGIILSGAHAHGLSPGYVAMLETVLERSRAALGAQCRVLEALASARAAVDAHGVAAAASIDEGQAADLLEQLRDWGWAEAAGDGGFRLVAARRSDVARVTGRALGL
jgi:hypothetical protein